MCTYMYGFMWVLRNPPTRQEVCAYHGLDFKALGRPWFKASTETSRRDDHCSTIGPELTCHLSVASTPGAPNDAK